jgi:hypothetical protein
MSPLLGYVKKDSYNNFGVKQHEQNIVVAKGWGNQINVNTFGTQRQSPSITDRTISASSVFLA